MNKKVLFEGKVTLGDRIVDFRIYKNEGDDVLNHYSYDFNPQVSDKEQIDFHIRETMCAETLERLLFRFQIYQSEFTTIVEERPNPNF